MIGRKEFLTNSTEWKKPSMINLNSSTLMNRPIKDVFAFLSNPNNVSKWNSAVMSLQQITPGAVGVGTKFKSIGEMMGRRVEGEMQISAYEPDTKCGFQVNAGPMQINFTFILQTVGSNTKVSIHAQGNPRGILKLAEGLMVGRIKSRMEEDLIRLKSEIEKGA